MDILVSSLTAFLVSALTLFSGFGLGTLLMPVFALFYPVELAISMTAVVHLFNNLLKLLLLGRFADKHVVIQFGVPAIIAAFGGAWTLAHLSNVPALTSYHMLGHEFSVLPLKLAIGSLLIIFAVLELTQSFDNLGFERKYLPLGGLLSGFFGGLSGHQGALRSAFLIKSGLSKEAFLGSGVVIACLVDFGRLAVYGAEFSASTSERNHLLAIVIGSAFAGTWLGNHLAQKTTIRTIQVTVSILVFGIAVGLVLGML